MAWIGAAIAGGVALMGDSMAQSGQQATNAMSEQNMLQQESWQTDMSNTAMQRRVTDLKQAGLNPMLAVGSNGAQVGSVGQPNLQNPDAAFGQLGQQASSAVQLAQQGQQVQSGVALNSANANKMNADANYTNVMARKAAGVDTDLSVSTINTQNTQQLLNQANAEAAGTQAALNNAQIQQVQQRLPEIQANITALLASAGRDEAQANYSKLLSSMQGLQIQQFKQMAPQLIQQLSNSVQSGNLDIIKQIYDQSRQASESKFYTNVPNAPTANWLADLIGKVINPVANAARSFR